MDEISRVRALHEHAVLDTEAEERFDRVAGMAAAYFDAPIALVSLVDTDRQWFKACIGLDVRQTTRDWAFCHHAIQLGADQVMVVEDATKDRRFVDNPLVTGEPNIRFYAGATLTTKEGANLGTLCVIDTQPRTRPSEADLAHLASLAKMVVDQIELSKARKALEERHQVLDLAEKLSLTGYWTLNTDTGAVFWSPQVYAIHGVDDENYRPGLDDALAFYVDGDRQMVETLLAENAAAGKGWDFDATIQRRDGTLRNVRSVAACQKDPNGHVRGFIGVFKDLTDERRVIAEAVEQERRYRLLADHASDVIAVYGADGRFTYLSPSITELLGYLPDELLGKTPYDLIAPEDQARVASEFAAAARSKSALTVEYRVRSKDGRSRWLEARPRFHRDEAGKVIQITDSVRDVTERREREVALAEARVAAESAATAKAEFLANMSHEIRTPLNGVIGFAEVLANTVLDTDQKRYVDRIRTAGKGLSALIDDILDFSKIESGNMTIEARPFDLRAMATEIVDLTRASIAGRLHLDIDYDGGLADRVIGDEQRTRQVLLNLIGNAAKFTHAGSVRLEVRRRQDWLEFRVVDTGIGISAEAMSRLFDGFTQADASVGRRFGGTGLGLNISRSLARLMNGDVTLESEPDVGTTAIFSLPYKPSADQPVSLPLRSARQRSERKLRILAVDDVPTNLELIEILVAGVGHDVTCAASGEAALERLRADPAFDLILMDVQMPGMDGLEATRRIRRMPEAANVPIVALTANVLADQIEACRAAGMDDHLAKPIKPEVLGETLDRVCRMAVPPPSSPTTPHGADPLAALKERYREQMKTFATEYSRMLAMPSEAGVAAIAAYTHSIAGTAGSLGFADVSTAAFQLESAAKQCREDGSAVESLPALIQAVLRAVEHT
ncbi:PAS domain-containing protein [Brevundimonas halotolerans]|uniref:Sensory/regulatory protein RpfC n=1 Tax=Brevundimonas halotolerans TaxID=69670 RepID=A0A7W9A3A1_9CAUL|nr:PAS domain-containing protein [Brevundimonas halotolerans]MBB5660418.1 PAS domain S-box-containing protein [Brevundimonas halotolerans]